MESGSARVRLFWKRLRRLSRRIETTSRLRVRVKGLSSSVCGRTALSISATSVNLALFEVEAKLALTYKCEYVILIIHFYLSLLLMVAAEENNGAAKGGFGVEPLKKVISTKNTKLSFVILLLICF